MQGQVVSFDAEAGEGVISGDDGSRYRFSAGEVGTGLRPRPGQRVDFDIAIDGAAANIVFVAASVERTVQPAGRIDLGRTIQLTFSSIRDNWLIAFGAAAVLVGIPGLIAGVGQGGLALEPTAGQFILLGVGSLLGLVGYLILQGAIISAIVGGVLGKPTSFGEAMSVGAKRCVTVFAVAIVMGVGTALGLLLLIVPGVILAVIWSAATPAAVVERLGVFTSLKRSRDLTRGNRWTVAAFGVIMVILIWLITLAFGIVLGVIGLAVSGLGGPTIVQALLSSVGNVIGGVIGTTGTACLYSELRRVKEGAGPEDLASVFD